MYTFNTLAECPLLACIATLDNIWKPQVYLRISRQRAIMRDTLVSGTFERISNYVDFVYTYGSEELFIWPNGVTEYWKNTTSALWPITAKL